MSTPTKSFNFQKIIGLSLLALNFALGYAILFWDKFIDEADNLVVGSLIFSGETLYRDIFSHHFPFPYFWMAAVVAVFGKSLFAARLSLLAFQVASFFIAMKISARYLLVGLVALLWGILRPFYFGHALFYSSFAGVALFVVLLGTLRAFDEDFKPAWVHWLTIGLFSLVALLSNPLTIYAMAVALVFLFIHQRASACRAGLVIAMGLVIFAGWLLATGTLTLFWQSVIEFNAQVYSKYIYTAPVRIMDFAKNALSGLGILNPSLYDINPFKIVDMRYVQLDNWLFTGFLFRAAIIICTILLLAKRKFSLAAFIYLFAAATLVIAKTSFRAQPFIFTALFAISAILTDEFGACLPSISWRRAQQWARIAILLLAVWMGFRFTSQIYQERNKLSYEVHFKDEEKHAAQIMKLTCGQADVLLADYPTGIYSYWFTDLQPASKYLFLWPWVAEVGQDEVIAQLHDEELVIVILNNGIVWGQYDTAEYLRPLNDFLNENYQRVGPNTFLSPELFARCNK